MVRVWVWQGVWPSLQDVEWEAVFQLLHLLRHTLQCRTLTLSAMADLSPLVPLLTYLTDSHSPRLALFNTKPNVVEVASSVYPLLAILASYPAHLDRRAQHDLVCCLEAGLVGKEAVRCTAALSVCALELQPTMTRSDTSPSLPLPPLSLGGGCSISL